MKHVFGDDRFLERLKVVILQAELSVLKQENWQPTGLIFQIMGGEQTKNKRQNVRQR
jgi:hypothetical protein